MKKALPYIITAAVGAAAVILIVFAVYHIHTIPATRENAQRLMMMLSNAFFVPGVCIAGVGLIIFASNGGAFDMLAFGIIRFFDLFRKNSKGKYKDFYEYRQSKKDRKTRMSFMLLVGLAYIAVAAIFLICYYNV